MKSGAIEVRNGIVSLVLICFRSMYFYRMMSAASAVTRTFAPDISTPTFLENL